MSFQPQAQGVTQISELLLSSRSTDNKILRKFHEDIEHLSQTVPELPCYFAHILASSDYENGELRILSGYALKAYIHGHFDLFQSTSLSYVKDILLKAIEDKNAMVGSVAGDIVSVLSKRIEIDKWPEAITQLAKMISDPNATGFFSALYAVHHLCEDGPVQLAQAACKPLALLLPPLLPLVSSNDMKVAVAAIRSFSGLMGLEDPVLNSVFPSLLQAIFHRAMDPTLELRQTVCNFLVKVFEQTPEHLEPQLDTIVQYMLHCTQSEDVALALEACEFWICMAEHPGYHGFIHPYLPQLLPTLFQRIVYSKEELAEFGDLSMLDSHVPDLEHEIKPRHFRGKHHEASGHKIDGKLEEQAEKGDAGEESDSSDDDEVVEQWTLRKCSAATLDIVSNVFESELLTPVLPLLKEKLTHQNWLHREAGILALGAIAEGCMDGIKVHLPQLVPYLITALNEEPLIRSIACWTLSRFSSWIVYEEGNVFLEPLIHGLLKNCTFGSKKVQEAACVSLATFEETAGVTIHPFLPAILRVLVQCFQIYQKRNLLALYDCLRTLTEAVGTELNKPEYIQMLLPPLLEKWQIYSDTDKDLLPFFECMASVVVAFGLGFHSYSKDVLVRSIGVINGTYQAIRNYEANPTGEEPDRDFYIVALDLISGVLQGLRNSAESLVQMYLNDILNVLKITFNDPEPSVRQSALGLLGELVLDAYTHIQPYIRDFFLRTIDFIVYSQDLAHLQVCGNALWISAELTERMGSDMAPFIPALVERALPIFQTYHSELSQVLSENFAMALARYGHVAPEEMAKHLMSFAEPWLNLMIKVKAGREKESAFNGFIKIVQFCPNAFISLLPRFIEALIRYPHVSNTTESTFKNVTLAFHSLLGNDQWNQFASSLHPHTRELMLKRFGV